MREGWREEDRHGERIGGEERESGRQKERVRWAREILYWTSSWLTLKAKSQLNREVKGRGVIIGKIERIRKAKVKQQQKMR